MAKLSVLGVPPARSEMEYGPIPSPLNWRGCESAPLAWAKCWCLKASSVNSLKETFRFAATGLRIRDVFETFAMAAGLTFFGGREEGARAGPGAGAGRHPRFRSLLSASRALVCAALGLRRTLSAGLPLRQRCWGDLGVLASPRASSAPPPLNPASTVDSF